MQILLSKTAQSLILARVAGRETSSWQARIEGFRHAYRLQADALAKTFGKELNVTTDDVLWGLGQVNNTLCLQTRGVRKLYFTLQA